MSDSNTYTIIDNLTYQLSDTEAHLVGLVQDIYGNMPTIPKSITIPSHINGLPVTSVEDYAFTQTDLKEIVLPDTIKIIKSSAFMECSELEKVNIPKDLVEIEGAAFACCKINSITIPGNVRLHLQAFYGCGDLHTVVLKEGIESLPLGIFTHCGIKHIFLPDSLKEIKYEALMGVDKNMMIHCSKGSYAEKWAKEHDYQVLYGRTSLTAFLNENLTEPKIIK